MVQTHAINLIVLKLQSDYFKRLQTGKNSCVHTTAVAIIIKLMISFQTWRVIRGRRLGRFAFIIGRSQNQKTKKKKVLGS